MTDRLRVLVVGATGCIGSRLTDALVAQGHDVVAFSRSASQSTFPYGVETFDGDLGDPASVDGLCEDVDVAYYLIHSLRAENFAELDRRYARRFREMASAAGVDRVVYLSGISRDDELSPHLASRREVESVLASGSFDLTVLRAAIVIGPQSASFRIVDDLTDRVPVLFAPLAVRTPCQPIYVSDAVEYLAALLDVDETCGATYDVGGPGVWCYESILELTAAEKGRRIAVVPTPMLTPEVAAFGLRFVTDVPHPITRALLESIRHPVTVHPDRDLQDVVPIDRTHIETAIRRALAGSRADAVAGRVR